jgi:general secretion pathway protein A
MYTSFFGLNEKPFSITPDPRYLFMSERHGEALAHLVYGVTESGGFIQLTGEVGTGKTTLCRTLLLNKMPANADVAVVLNPQLSALEFLEAICEEVDIPVPEPRGSVKALIDALNRHLLNAHADGRRTILVVDEAQNLAPEVLEQVRLLTNLETAKQKLLQIILIGQPELRELLARNDLRQLAQRITGRYHLEPLTRSETNDYIEHRLKVAGALGEVFDAPAKREIFRLSQGVPRLINVICDRALLGAYSQGSRRVDRKLVRRAAAEITGEPELAGIRRWSLPIALGAAVAIAVATGAWLYVMSPRSTMPEAAVAAVIEVPEPRTLAAATATLPTVSAEVPDSVPEPQPALSLEEQLVLARDLTTEAAALDSLFDLWGLNFTPSAVGCRIAETEGFACLLQRGSWSGLQQLDRPAVIELVDSSGDGHFVVLKGIEDDQAEILIGGVDVMHPVADIAALWFGQYQLLWQPANGDFVALGPGARGAAAVRWLRQSLAAIDPRYATDSPDPEIYDSGLTAKVRDFQRDHRLEVDGVAGQQTQIIINSLLAPDGTPRLVAPQVARKPTMQLSATDQE